VNGRADVSTTRPSGVWRDRPAGDGFVADAARCIAAMEPADLAPGALAFPLALSRCVVEHGLSWAEAADGLLELRAALLAHPAVDPISEPVPLLPPDARTRVWNLAVYLWHLLTRIRSC